MNIPIKQTSDQYTVTVATLDRPRFVIGPLPLARHGHHILARLRNAVIDALAVFDWIIGLMILLAALSPSFSGQLEDHISWMIVGWAEEPSGLYTTK
jgi:hypothetical protein